jgi:hypothetical protein
MPGTPLRYNRFAYNWKLASLVHAIRDMPLSAVCLDLIVAHPVPYNPARHPGIAGINKLPPPPKFSSRRERITLGL